LYILYYKNKKDPKVGHNKFVPSRRRC